MFWKQKKKIPKDDISQKLGKKETNKKPSVEQSDKFFDLAFIGRAPFMHLAKFKKEKAEIFAISMRDIEYQLNKKMNPLIDLKTIVSVEYHDFLNVFSKETFDILRPYDKSNHKIKLLKDAKLSNFGHSILRDMLVSQLEFVKKFLKKHLKKKFIKASRASCSSLILLAKKPGGGVRFCVDY